MFKMTLASAILALFSSATYSQVTSQIANQQLTTEAKLKIARGQIDLNALLQNNSNDLIIEYHVTNQPFATSSQTRQQFADTKALLRTRLQRASGLELLRDYNNLPYNFYRISNRDTLVNLLNDPQVKAVYPNRHLTLNRSQTLNFINQPAAQASGFTGKGTSIAVLDTGLNYRHQDFGSCSTLGSTNCKVSHSIDIARDDNSLDDNGHGSNVSSIALGVAPDAKIISLDVFSRDFLGRHGASDNDLVAATNWVINNAKTLNIKAANLSLGFAGQRYNSHCSGALQTPFRNLRNAGVLPVVASGNDGFSNGISYPACLDAAVSVGAVYDNNIGTARYQSCTDSVTYSDRVTCFSNSSNLLTLLAPGAQVTAVTLKVVLLKLHHTLLVQLLY